MEFVFHERQEGRLCAQHCLNSLLQGHYFTAVDLAHIATKLDESERDVIAENNIMVPSGKSNNMDDTGFFSVQVVSEALKVWSLELLPLGHPEAASFRADPNSAFAYICNHREHWLALRKFGGHHWLNLNSTLKKPQLISQLHLDLFISQLKNDGYSVFVVIGVLPQSKADEAIRSNPGLLSFEREKPGSTKFDPFSTPGHRLGGDSTITNGFASESDDLNKAIALSLQNNEEKDDIQKALELSRRSDLVQDHTAKSALEKSLEEKELQDMERALKLSLESTLASSCASIEKDSTQKPSKASHVEEVRNNRANFLAKFESSGSKETSS